LIETLRAYGKPVICAFEATGNYHRSIAWRLIEAGFDVRLVGRSGLVRLALPLSCRIEIGDDLAQADFL
jgi:hypothetical protein